MNTTNYSILVSQNGSLPSVQSKNSATYWDFMQAGYQVIFEGTKAECNRHFEELMSELENIEYFA